MLKQNQPVRRNVPQRIEYTFVDQTGNPIDITIYGSVAFEAKVQGQTFSSVAAAFGGSTGLAFVDSFIFNAAGIWTIQFYCAGKLYGEPLQVIVAANVEDMTTNQLLRY